MQRIVNVCTLHVQVCVCVHVLLVPQSILTILYIFQTNQEHAANPMVPAQDRRQ